MRNCETLRFLSGESVPDVLQALAARGNGRLSAILREFAAPSTVEELESGFVRHNLVAMPEMGISPRGRVCDCCIDAIEGDNLVEIIDRLRDIDPTTSRISLIREGMTNAFIHLVSSVEPLRRVMVCSPWVNLSRERLQTLAYGVEKTRRATGFLPELWVVTRPIAEQPDGASNATLAYFRRVNAVINYRPSLHSKLYILETGTSPSRRYAFVGSENFTKVRYQELGIRVDDDNLIIEDLVRYFLRLGDPVGL